MADDRFVSYFAILQGRLPNLCQPRISERVYLIVPGDSYSFRPSRSAPERQYRLTSDRLTWTGSEGGIAYRDVARVKVYQSRFWGSSRAYWTCKLYPYRGKKLYLSAAHVLSGRAIEDRTQSYIPFIKELEARITGANKNVSFVVGRGWLSRIEGGVGSIAVLLLRQIWRFDCHRTATVLAALLQKIGPRLRGHRTARAQLRIAFPEKKEEEAEAILDGMWDNLGRVVAEYGHLG